MIDFLFKLYSKEEKDELKEKIKQEIRDIPKSKWSKVVEIMIEKENMGFVLKRALDRIREIKKELGLYG